MAKSISRLTGELAAAELADAIGGEMDPGEYLSMISSFRRVQSGYRQVYGVTKKESPAALSFYNDAVERYRADIAPYITIVEAGSSIGLYTVEDVKDEFYRQCTQPGDTETGPDLIVIDYLQLLALPEGRYLSDKQKTDDIVLALSRLRREINKPILVISSTARANYTENLGLDSMKESGSIEYSAECVLGLQYDPKTYDAPKDRNEARKQQLENGKHFPRQVEVIVLKSRYGGLGGRVPMDFYPAANFYQEATDRKPEEESPEAETGAEAQEEATYTAFDPDLYIAEEMKDWLTHEPGQTAYKADLISAFIGRNYSKQRIEAVLLRSDLGLAVDYSGDEPKVTLTAEPRKAAEDGQE